MAHGLDPVRTVGTTNVIMLTCKSASGTMFYNLPYSPVDHTFALAIPSCDMWVKAGVLGHASRAGLAVQALLLPSVLMGDSMHSRSMVHASTCVVLSHSVFHTFSPLHCIDHMSVFQ